TERRHPAVSGTREVAEERVRRDETPDCRLRLGEPDEDQPGPRGEPRPSGSDALIRWLTCDRTHDATATPARRRSNSTAPWLASTALAHATSERQPGAATMSPARNTPSPRSIGGRSRQVVPGM